MMYLSKVRASAPQETAAALEDVHEGMGQIGRLVLSCAIVLLVSAALLIGTALQVMTSIDHADLNAERLRVSNAIDIIVSESGPLDAAGVERLGRLIGLRDAGLETAIRTDSNRQQIPLVGNLGPSGSFLAWTRVPAGQNMFLQFAPIRLPIMIVMMLAIIGLLLRLRSVVADIERQRRFARQQSHSDVVTGLANRLAFEGAVTRLRESEAPFALLVFDLDRFKTINDAFGHAAGDIVLQAVGARLSRLLGPGDLLARVGGDEFVLLSQSRYDPASLSILARHCIAAVQSPIHLVNRAVTVGISFGIVVSESPHPEVASLMSRADAALYRAKSIRGSAYQFANAQIAKPLQAIPA